MAKTSALTADRVRAVLSYDKASGDFHWIVKMSSRAMPGNKAGTKHKFGYIQIKIDGVIHKAQRLAWLHVTGHHPQGEIDHRNRVRDDNRWENLRDVSTQVNRQNVGPESRKGSYPMGVTLHRKSGLFQAHIKMMNRHISLGYYTDPDLAHQAYIAAKRKMHTGCTL